MNSNWIIIADDFTGAGDSAVQFGASGKPVRLLLNSWNIEESDGAVAAVVVDTDTRLLSGDEAYARVVAAASRLYAAGARRFYKKIDSTLRGNPADEIAAVMDAAKYRFAVVAPAAPRNRRTVVDGICRIDGRPLLETAVARDPFTPVKEERVAKLMERRFPDAVRELTLDLVRSGKEKLRSKIETEMSKGARLFAIDAETMEDLRSVACLSDMDGVLFAGSSGLAEALAKTPAAEKPALPNVPRGQALFVIGSVTSTSAGQCARLVGDGGAAEIVAATKSVLSDAGAEMKRLRALIAEASPERALLIRTSGSDTPGAVDFSDKDAGAAISRFLGELTVEAARIRPIRFLFASGGDTAARIASALGAESIDFIAEILPGLPFGFFQSNALERRMYFVSKSGGFGDQDAMADSLAMVSPASVVGKEQAV